MGLGTIAWLVGLILTMVSFLCLFPLGVALWFGEPWRPFAQATGVGFCVGVALLFLFRRSERALDHRLAFLAVTLAWLSAAAVGTLPLLFHPTLELAPADAVFEAVSGLTATGATVLSGLDHMPRSVLLWRSLCHWLGGLGMVLLGVAVLPMLGVGGMQLFKAETAGVTKDKITPRIAETAKLLWILYLGLTLVDGVLLLVGGMAPFDAICHAMSTIATGGFSTHDASLGAYDSGFIHAVTTVFMLLGATSFALLHRGLTRGIRWAENPELRLYVGIFAFATLLIAVNLRVGMPEQFGTAAEALEHAAFQVAAILTTTGFTTQDFGEWPGLAQAVLLGLFFVGGMAGSTAGGIKVVRVLLLGRIVFSRFFLLVHPRAIDVITLGGRRVEQAVVLSLVGFFGIWLLLLAAGTLVVAAFGSDLFTSFAAAAATLGNVGPGLAGVGPAHTYADFAPGAKLVLAALMVLGRLEIYTVLVILTPGFWRD